MIDSDFFLVQNYDPTLDGILPSNITEGLNSDINVSTIPIHESNKAVD